MKKLLLIALLISMPAFAEEDDGAGIVPETPRCEKNADCEAPLVCRPAYLDLETGKLSDVKYCAGK